jgi:tetratricopeptide (TPR) repeat protein
MVVILHGMGGSGKTQLALKYCRQSMDTQRHNSIFWVDASTPKTTAQSFAAIEGLIFNCKVDLSKVEASVKRVVAEMSKWQTAWLIVFDNFDEPSLFDDEGKNIRDYFPRGKRGSILFTTRNDGKDIINRLGYFALAIDQAGAYIRARNLAPGLFIDHFNNRKEKILKEIPALWEYTKKLSDAETVTAVSVFTTWEMSFQQIKGDGDQKMKKEHLLTTSAFLDHRYIHQALFGCYFAHSSPEWMSIFTVDGVYVKYEFGDVLAEFKLLSLLEYVEVHLETGIHFVIHPLIQDWIKLRLTFEECQNYIIETIDILAAYVSGCDFIAMTLQSRQALVAHLNVSMENNDHYRTKRLENPEMKYAAFKFASFYQSEGFYAKAEKLFSMSIAAGESQVGLEDPETLKMMGHLATIYSLQGKYSQAEKLYLEVLDGFKAQLGDNDISTIHSLHNLSLLYQQLDRYDEAERLGKQALELKTKILGRKDPSTLRSASCLATTYKLQGRYDEAENLYTRALNDINLQGEGHGWVAALDICQALATMHRLRRRFEEAEYWSKEILKLREQEFGPDHPSTCDTMAELGLVFKERNRNAEAMELFRRALRGNETVLGVDNPSTVNVRNELELLQNQEG